MKNDKKPHINQVLGDTEKMYFIETRKIQSLSEKKTQSLFDENWTLISKFIGTKKAV